MPVAAFVWKMEINYKFQTFSLLWYTRISRKNSMVHFNINTSHDVL